MKYSCRNFEENIEKINNREFIDKCRIYGKNFIRNRKVTPKDIILYEFNKKRLTSKMEILNFNKIKRKS